MCECAKLDSDLLNFLLYKTKKKAKSLATGIQKEMLEKKWLLIVPNRSDFKTYNLLNCYPHIKIYIGR